MPAGSALRSGVYFCPPLASDGPHSHSMVRTLTRVSGGRTDHRKRWWVRETATCPHSHLSALSLIYRNAFGAPIPHRSAARVPLRCSTSLACRCASTLLQPSQAMLELQRSNCFNVSKYLLLRLCLFQRRVAVWSQWSFSKGDSSRPSAAPSFDIILALLPFQRAHILRARGRTSFFLWAGCRLVTLLLTQPAQSRCHGFCCGRSLLLRSRRCCHALCC